MVLLTKGDNIWVDSDIGVAIGAKVKKVNGDRCTVVDDTGKERELGHQNGSGVSLMHPTSVEGVADMIRLGDLNEAGILRNLQLRHKQGHIYTYIGSVLVAVNPYELLPIYNAEQVHRYHGRQLGELPPHVFAIADACYFNMRRNHCNQCCIISGESGAGKTESTKLMLQFLAAVSGQHSWIEQQILEANPILEAFGNAKTIRNDNSSRFGKYVEIFFNNKGIISGAHMEQYLLEKSRVCHQASNERNYHIFYCLLMGLPQEKKKILSLGKAEDYNYLNGSGCITCEGREDAADFTRIRSALKILTFGDGDCWDIFKMLAAILHMGNIDFQGSILNNMDSSDITASPHFNMAATLLEVDTGTLDASLTRRTFLTNRERVSKPLSSEKARDTRDAFAKAIYSKMFLWLFEKINVAIHKKPELGAHPNPTYQSIGLLDIFGFENFQSNSFEQLCINFANEQLQQFFVRHVFKLEQEEYNREDISWKRIVFTDNQPTLDLLAIKPLNILALIDEESNFPKGTDVTMLTKINQNHRSNGIYISPKSDHDVYFGIKHFAGPVYYDPSGFLEKNRDALSPDLMDLVQKSKSKLLRLLFDKELNVNAMKPTNNSKFIMTPKSSLKQVNEKCRGITTLSSQFRQSLDSLMKALTICQPHFIRCFKPNHSKAAKLFDRELCIRQLRDSGMLETIRIRKSGFPIRHTFREFLGRYRVLLNTIHCDPNTESDQDCCNAICKAIIRQEEDWRIGKTKIFLKDNHDSLLERERERELHRKATIITRVMLGHKDRRTFLKKKKAALLAQKLWRGQKDRKVYKQLLLGVTRLQAKVRSRRAHQDYKRSRKAAVVLQAQARGLLGRRQFTRQRDAAILLQKHARGLLARKKVNRLRTAALLSAQEKLEQEQMALELQRKLEEVLKPKPEPISEEDAVQSAFGFLGPAPDSVDESEAEPEIDKSFKARSVKKKDDVIITYSVVDPVKEEEDDEDEEFSFSRFCSLKFQGSATDSHIKLRLKQPLLVHDDEGDALACLSVWWIILRFMGDLPDPKAAVPTVSPTGSTAHHRVRQDRRLSNLVGLDQKMLRKNKKKLNKLANRRTSAIPEEPELPSTSQDNDVTDGNDIMIGEGPTLHRPMTSLEKIHIIVGYALSRPDIRDEIFCQICKQLTGNSNASSSKKGWILMSICLGIFPPTQDFMRYLRNFIRRGPADDSSYCMERLLRTVANGARQELACWLEMDACRSKKPVKVKLSLPDGRSLTLQVDSASISSEICSAVAKATGIRDDYGFSLYMAMHDKMWSLGNQGEHLMDAIAQCEQEVRRQGNEEHTAPYKLSFRKELFAPWPCPPDPAATSLTYRQVISGLQSGDYMSEKEDDFVQLAAMHYFVKFGSACSPDNTRQVVREVINTTLIENKSEQRWIQIVTTAHTKGSYINSQKSTETVQQEVVDYVRRTWPIFFSRFFEITYLSGPPLPQDKLILAVDWSGLSFFETKEKICMELPYAELQDVIISRNQAGPIGAMISLSTLRGEIIMEVQKGEELVEMVGGFLEGLRQRSLYAVAHRDANKQDDPDFLVYRRGDLLELHRDRNFSEDDRWIHATNERTSQSGAVSTDAIIILPTVTRPTEDTLNRLNLNPTEKRYKSKDEPITDRITLINLKEFSFEYFREPSKGVKGAAKEKLWANSREPLKHPLLKSLAGNSQLSNLAVQIFTAIMKYMGDYPIKQARSPLDLTDQIFSYAAQNPDHPELRDEIYCQIMKQLTNNNNSVSLERGWQLLWLCCSLYPPTDSLLRHTQRFIESRPREPLSATCLQRLRAMLSQSPRTMPPHQVEVDAIQQNSTQIYHKVHFPNDTTELYEVTHTTKNSDLCRQIASGLRLASSDGYSLFIKTTTKMVSLEDQEYFFDTLRKKTDVSKKEKKDKKGNQGVQLGSAPYLVLFLRKLWFNVVPGKDVTADTYFHFPQEVPKYLRGYHRCTKEDMISLAGLLFRVKVDSDRSQFVMIPRMLKDLVPADQMKLMSPEDWKKHIMSSYNKQSGISVEEAKVSFLRHISAWPTFGATFFEVKQTSDRKLPSVIRIGINKLGVAIIDPRSKEERAMYSFSQITNWSSGNTYFHLTLGNMVKGNTLLCETSMGYRMDDLLESYVQMYMAERQWNKPRASIFPTS
ncbi:unconventional myosin-VIIb [Engraulis encrasicolus]|uniref:unconventional myosin-VIIb n=1 Tax=Engraulis encrasicolus TaxID=184585 RepID=UPI002FD79132